MPSNIISPVSVTPTIVLGPNAPLGQQTVLPALPLFMPEPLKPFESFPFKYPFESGETFEPITSAPPKPTPSAVKKTAHKSSKLDDWAVKRAKPIYMPEATIPLTRLARKLAAEGGIEQPFKVLVVNKPHYNAGAFGNGTIIFNIDTLKRAKSPEELAFVMAHELSHIQFEDAKAKKKRYATATAAAFAIEELTTFAFKVRNFLKSLTISIAAPAAAFQWFAYHERKDEARADVNAIRLLSQAGYGTHGYRSAFEHMGQDMGKAPWWMHLQWKIFGEDHPALPKRKVSVEQAVRQYPITDIAKPCMSAEDWRDLKAAAFRVTTAKK